MTKKKEFPTDPCSHLESLRAEVVAFAVLATVLGSMYLVTKLAAGFPPKDQVWISVFSFLLHARLLVTLATQLVRSCELFRCEVSNGQPTSSGQPCPGEAELQNNIRSSPTGQGTRAAAYNQRTLPPAATSRRSRIAKAPPSAIPTSPSAEPRDARPNCFSPAGSDSGSRGRSHKSERANRRSRHSGHAIRQ